MERDLRSKIVEIRDWPHPGITCYETSALLRDASFFHTLIEEMAASYMGQSVNAVVGIEARGFLLAGALAQRLRTGAVMIRKRGKLPPPTIVQEYSYEYAAAAIEMNPHLIQRGDRVILVDDTIATGGTMVAAVKLLDRGGVEIIGISCIVLVDFMAGRERLKGRDIHAVVTYD